MTVESLTERPVLTKEIPSVGQILREFRAKSGLSQDEVARLVKISQGYLSQIENDEVKGLSLSTALGLAKVFGEGVLFLEGERSQKVFLLPLSRTIHQFLLTETDPEKIDDLEKGLDFICRRYPQIRKNNLTYIDQSDQKPLGERVEEFRAGRFQWVLAKDAGISQVTISNIETGLTKNPSIKNLAKIAQGAQITIEELLGLEEIQVQPKIRKFDQILRDGNIPQAKRKLAKRQIENTLELLEST